MTVADSGSGVAAALKERVFEPFFTTKKRGSGMGLSAAHGIVTNHGGTITVEDAPDAGAVFRVCFPATSVSVLTTSPGPVRMRKGGRRVLLVDDEATILEATSEILSAEGYSVVTADNGVEAIRIARDYGDAIDAIILDLRMPVLSGVDAFDSLVDACPRAQIVVATGFELDEDARTLLRNGAAAFLNKPFRSEKLLATIAQVVDDDAIASPGA